MTNNYFVAIKILILHTNQPGLLAVCLQVGWGGGGGEGETLELDRTGLTLVLADTSVT